MLCIITACLCTVCTIKCAPPLVRCALLSLPPEFFVVELSDWSGANEVSEGFGLKVWSVTTSGLSLSISYLVVPCFPRYQFIIKIYFNHAFAPLWLNLKTLRRLFVAKLYKMQILLYWYLRLHQHIVSWFCHLNFIRSLWHPVYGQLISI